MTTENDKTTTALAVRSQESLVPICNVTELMALSEAFAGAMPGVRNSRQALFVLMTCKAQQISPMEYHRTYHSTDNGPAMRADAMLAEFRNKGGRYKIVQNDCNAATIEATFEGQTRTFTYTIEDGKRTGDALAGNGALKDNWKKRPDDMMWARVISKMVRRLCPEINAGLYAPEETQDFIDVTPQRTDAAPVPLTAQDAAARAKPVVATVEVVKPITMDPTVCPVGDEEIKGHPWTEFDTGLLEAVLESNDEYITPEHRKVIHCVLADREGGAA